MQSLTQKIWELGVPQGIFDLTVIKNVFPNVSDGARRALVNRALKSGEVSQIRRGLYYLNEKFTKLTPHPFIVANRLIYPSFISMESALSFFGFIPEAVYQVSSITPGRAINIKTSLGVFYFHSVPSTFFYAGVNSERIIEDYWIFMATPLRAIADIVYTRKSVKWEKDGVGFLTKSLRIENEQLFSLDLNRSDEIVGSLKNKRTRNYIEKLREYIYHD